MRVALVKLTLHEEFYEDEIGGVLVFNQFMDEDLWDRLVNTVQTSWNDACYEDETLQPIEFDQFLAAEFPDLEYVPLEGKITLL